MNQAPLTFAEYLTNFREEHGWSQAEIARATGINQSLVSKHEAGTAVPGTDNLTKYATITGTPFEDLMRICGHLPGVSVIKKTDGLDVELRTGQARLASVLRRSGMDQDAQQQLVRSAMNVAIMYATEATELLAQDGRPTRRRSRR